MAIDLVVNAHRWGFDSKQLGKVMTEIGRRVRKNATIKMVVNRARGKSSGRYPSVVSGAMRKSIKARVSKSKYSVGIQYETTPKTEVRGFYPAFLLYGVKGRIKQYDNPITDAIAERRQELTDLITGIIDECFLLVKNET